MNGMTLMVTSPNWPPSSIRKPSSLAAAFLSSGSSDRLTQTRDQAFARQFQKILGRLARRKLEVRSCAAPDLNDVHLIVNDGAGRAMFGQHQPVGFSQHVRPRPALGNSLPEIHPAFGAAAFAQAWRRRTRGRPHAIDLVGLLHLMKRLGKRADAFRWTEYQEARWLEGVMQDRQHLALQYGSKVDQYVTATDEVQLGERRVLRHVVPGKNAYVTDGLRNLVPAFRSGEEPRQSLRRDMGQRGVRVRAGAGLFDGRFADIGGENLERKAHFRVVQELHQADGDRISLLARGAPRHPDPDRILGPSILNQSGKHLLLQFLEDRRFPKECSDGDQTALAQRVCFLAILLEIPAVVFQRFEPAEGHAPLDASREGAVLVVREVHSGGAPHQPEYPGQFRISRRLSRLPRLDRDLRIARDGHQLPRDSGRRQHKIRHAGGDGASRHAVVLRGSHFLSEGDAARGLDRLEAQRPIGCGSRQNDAEGFAAAVCRQGAEKKVDRHVAATLWPGQGSEGLHRKCPDCIAAESRKHDWPRRESRLSLQRPAFCLLWKATPSDGSRDSDRGAESARMPCRYRPADG